MGFLWSGLQRGPLELCSCDTLDRHRGGGGSTDTLFHHVGPAHRLLTTVTLRIDARQRAPCREGCHLPHGAHSAHASHPAWAYGENRAASLLLSSTQQHRNQMSAQINSR
ncbi:unnamed protein product [Lampetra fluviatilis]